VTCWPRGEHWRIWAARHRFSIALAQRGKGGWFDYAFFCSQVLRSNLFDRPRPLCMMDRRGSTGCKAPEASDEGRYAALRASIAAKPCGHHGNAAILTSMSTNNAFIGGVERRQKTGSSKDGTKGRTPMRGVGGLEDILRAGVRQD